MSPPSSSATLCLFVIILFSSPTVDCGLTVVFTGNFPYPYQDAWLQAIRVTEETREPERKRLNTWRNFEHVKEALRCGNFIVKMVEMNCPNGCTTDVNVAEFACTATQALKQIMTMCCPPETPPENRPESEGNENMMHPNVIN